MCLSSHSAHRIPFFFVIASVLKFSRSFLYLDIIEIAFAWTENWLEADKNLMKSQRKFSFRSRIECFAPIRIFRLSDVIYFCSYIKQTKYLAKREREIGWLCWRNIFGTITDEITNVCALIDVIENFETWLKCIKSLIWSESILKKRTFID